MTQEGYAALLNVVEKKEVSGLLARTGETGENIEDTLSIVERAAYRILFASIFIEESKRISSRDSMLEPHDVALLLSFTIKILMVPFRTFVVS